MESVRLFRDQKSALNAIKRKTPAVVYLGDCLNLISAMEDGCVDLTLTSPPYSIGKEYEEERTLDDFVLEHEALLPEIFRITREGGSICWQVGYFATAASVVPLDFVVFDILSRLGAVLRNRVIWTFGHGFHHKHRFDGRHEVILWFTKGASSYHFDLDAVRVPQKYPGKRKGPGPRQGEFSGNPLGKNPGDVWDIPNVKSNHIEKLNHPCQFPVGLADRLIRALTPSGGLVVDPFSGVASTGVAATFRGRQYLGAEISPAFANTGLKRLKDAFASGPVYRPAERPVFVPGPGLSVARRPSHFVEYRGGEEGNREKTED